MTTPYHYTECGLDNVLIYGIEPKIDDDGDEVIEIANINGLHKAVALMIIGRHGLMSGKELRFLRTEMGLTQAELAILTHKDAQSIGRWERGEVSIDPNAETLIRLMARERLRLRLDVAVDVMTGYSVQTATTPAIEISSPSAGKYLPGKAAA